MSIVDEDVERMLDDSIARALASIKPLSTHWQELSTAGFLGINVPGELGGLDGDLNTALVLARQAGRNGVRLPVVSTITAVEILKRCEGNAHLAGIQAGLVYALALADVVPAASRTVPVAKFASGKWTLSGTASFVPDGMACDHFIVEASADDQTHLLYQVRSDDTRRTAISTRDQSDSARVEFESAPAELISEAPNLARFAVKCGIAATCGEMLGAAEYIFGTTRQYLKERSQFGQLLETFQVLQHSIADMALTMEMARAMTSVAATAAGAEGAAAEWDLNAAKYIVGQGACDIADHAVQLHGAIGLTKDLPMSRYINRIRYLDQLFGSQAHHFERLGELIGPFPICYSSAQDRHT